jgi:hypothetical protein
MQKEVQEKRKTDDNFWFGRKTEARVVFRPARKHKVLCADRRKKNDNEDQGTSCPNAVITGMTVQLVAYYGIMASHQSIGYHCEGRSHKM